MKVLPITLPRTRSTYLYEALKGYQEHLGLISLKNHSEYFLEVNRNVEFHDAKTETFHSAEILPIVHNNKLQMHFIYPHLFDNAKDRNNYKLDVLRQEKAQGREYYIKGTQAMSHNIEKLTEFFHDRTILLTTRENMIDNVLSAQFAHGTKIFHCREENKDIYMRNVNNGFELDIDKFKFYINLIRDFEDVEEYLIKNNIEHKKFTYERLTDDRYISDVLDSDEWLKYRNPNHHSTIHIEKDYSKIIKNYDECVQEIEKLLNAKRT